MLDSLGFNVRKNPKDLYHVSFNGNLPSTLYPQLPAGSELATGDEKYPEPQVDRVCLGETITGCIRAMYPNIAKVVEGGMGKPLTMHVYQAKNIKKTKMFSPEVLTTSKYVWDAKLTGEWWAIEPVEIQHLREVLVYFNTEGKWVDVAPFDTEPPVKHSPESIVIKEL